MASEIDDSNRKPCMDGLQLSLQSISRSGYSAKSLGSCVSARSNRSRTSDLVSSWSHRSGLASEVGGPVSEQIFDLLADERERRKEGEQRLHDVLRILSHRIEHLQEKKLTSTVDCSPDGSINVKSVSEGLRWLEVKYGILKGQVDNIQRSFSGQFENMLPTSWQGQALDLQSAMQNLTDLEDRMMSMEQLFERRCDTLETQMAVFNGPYFEDLVSEKVQEHCNSVGAIETRLQSNLEKVLGIWSQQSRNQMKSKLQHGLEEINKKVFVVDQAYSNLSVQVKQNHNDVEASLDSLRRDLTKLEEKIASTSCCFEDRCNELDAHIMSSRNQLEIQIKGNHMAIENLADQRYSELTDFVNESAGSTTSLIDSRCSNLESLIDDSCKRLEARVQKDLEKTLAWREEIHDQFRAQTALPGGIGEVNNRMQGKLALVEQECLKIGVQISEMQSGDEKSLDCRCTELQRSIDDKTAWLVGLLTEKAGEATSVADSRCRDLEASIDLRCKALEETMQCNLEKEFDKWQQQLEGMSSQFKEVQEAHQKTSEGLAGLAQMRSIFSAQISKVEHDAEQSLDRKFTEMRGIVEEKATSTRVLFESRCNEVESRAVSSCIELEVRIKDEHNAVRQLAEQRYKELAAGMNEKAGSTTSLIDSRCSGLELLIDKSRKSLEARVQGGISQWQDEQEELNQRLLEGLSGMERDVSTLRSHSRQVPDDGFEDRFNELLSKLVATCSELEAQITKLQTSSARALEQNTVLAAQLDIRCNALDARIGAINVGELLGCVGGQLHGRINDMQVLLERRCNAVETLCTGLQNKLK